jgi:hypothetical protein
MRGKLVSMRRNDVGSINKGSFSRPVFGMHRVTTIMNHLNNIITFAHNSILRIEYNI